MLSFKEYIKINKQVPKKVEKYELLDADSANKKMDKILKAAQKGNANQKEKLWTPV